MPVPVLLFALGLAGVSGIGAGPAEACAASTVETTLDHFVRAFEALDEQRFLACFTDDATVFHPRAPDVARTDARERFVEAWRGVFARIRRSSGRTAPPYHHLTPSDLRIQVLSPEVALVTFHLRDPAQIGRRTLVLRRLEGRWFVAHVHASNLADAASP